MVDVLNTIQSVINNGEYQLKVVTSVPTWIGVEGEFLLYISGTVRRLYFYDVTNLTWEFIEFNNAGRGQATISAIVQLTAQAAAINTTTLFTPSAAGLYRVSVYMNTTTTGTGSLSCTIGFSDEAGARTTSPAGTVDLSGLNASTGITFLSTNTTAITYATAIAGLAGSPKYSLRIVLEQLA